MSKFKEQRLYDADGVDSEIAILTGSINFYKKKCLELQKRLDKYE